MAMRLATSSLLPGLARTAGGGGCAILAPMLARSMSIKTSPSRIGTRPSISSLLPPSSRFVAESSIPSFPGLVTYLRSAYHFHSSATASRPALASSSSASTTNSTVPPTTTSTSAHPPSSPTPRIVGYHSLFLALLVYAIILVGGLTRLTESGLSITEWNPGLKGMWLPSSDEEWQGEWAKYRETPEFHLLNARMSLDDFKTIYMWEWSHRILGRVIGVAYIVPSLYFLARGYVKPPFRSKLLLIGLGIGAQGAMGWYMVKSGLAAPQGSLAAAQDSNDHTTSGALAPASTPASWTPRVSHFRLAAHLGLAFIVYAGMLRTGLSILREYNLSKNVGMAAGLKTGPGVRERIISVLSRPELRRYKRFTAAVTALVFVTAMSGALVAGLDAGLLYNEFPMMGDGRVAPPLDEMFDDRYGRRALSDVKGQEGGGSSFIIGNLTQNPVTVQFIHRCLAVTTFAHVVALSWKTRTLQRVLAKQAIALPPAIPRLATATLAVASLQVTLGISTLIYLVPIPLASAHQAGSVALLSLLLALWGALRVPSTGGLVSNVKQAYSVAQAVRGGSAVGASAARTGVRVFSTIAHCKNAGRSRLPSPLPTSSGLRTFSSSSLSRIELASLPDKVRIRTGPAGRLSKVLPPRESSDITTRVGSSYGGNHSLEWVQAPRNILIVTKAHDEKTQEAMVKIISHVASTYPWMHIILEESNSHILSTSPSPSKLSVVRSEERRLLCRKVDIVITLGGDGTILHASSLFDHSPVPPVLSFSMGTLGFLLPWHIDHFKLALQDLLESRVSLLLRMRLRQSIHEANGDLVESGAWGGGEIHLMNEVALHRGREAHMTTIDAFVDGTHLTQAISDGLIIASPTGSTAYSLSAGGPIVHPSVQSLLLTPICPRSLSFRPVLLPSDSTIQLKISSTSRSSAELTIDGREIQTLSPGQYLEISMSPFPIPCVNRASSSSSAYSASSSSSHTLDKREKEKENEVEVDRRRNGKKNPEPRLVEGAGSASPVERKTFVGVGPNSDRGEDDWVKDINTLLRFNASFAGRGLVGGAEDGG